MATRLGMVLSAVATVGTCIHHCTGTDSGWVTKRMWFIPANELPVYCTPSTPAPIPHSTPSPPPPLSPPPQQTPPKAPPQAPPPPAVVDCASDTGPEVGFCFEPGFGNCNVYRRPLTCCTSFDPSRRNYLSMWYGAGASVCTIWE